MLRKIFSKMLPLRKTISRTALNTHDINHESTDDDYEDEPESSRIFRRAFLDKLTVFKLEADILAEGNTSFNESWKDTLGKEGLGLSATMIAVILGLLGGLAIISAAVSAGAAVGVAVVGLITVVAYSKYRDHVKQQNYGRASYLLDRVDLRDEIRLVALLLADMYQLQLASCTVEDAHQLAESCARAISQNMLKNEHFRFRELMDPVTLQVVLMRTLPKIPKDKLEMKLMAKEKYNTRGLIGHSAYYIRETDEFYQASKSKATKYGVLFFDSKVDLEDYESILAESMKGSKALKFTKMAPHEVDALLQSSMFKAYQNDEIFTEKRESGVENKGERMRIV